MLKPKRKIVRKEIGRDPFLETVDKLEANISKNRKLYINIAAGFVIALIAFNLITNKRSERLITGNAAVGRALVAIERGDVENARFQLETIIADYDGKTIAEVAGYHLGKIKFDEGDFIDAEKYLLQYMEEHPVDIFIPGASKMLAAIAVINGDRNTAEKYLNEGIDLVSRESDKLVLKLEKAQLILSGSRGPEAKLLIDHVLNAENIPPGIKQKAEEMLGMIPS